MAIGGRVNTDGVATRGPVSGRGPRRSRGRDGVGTRSDGTKPYLPSLLWLQKYHLRNLHHVDMSTYKKRSMQQKKSLSELLPRGIRCASDGNRTRTAIAGHGILSPACLPIPPPKQCGCKDNVKFGIIKQIVTFAWVKLIS